MHHDLASKIESNVDKLIKTDFIREIQYSTWLANIVSIKRRKHRSKRLFGILGICVDFWDQNKACPKEYLPIPHSDLVVDATTSYEIV